MGGSSSKVQFAGIVNRLITSDVTTPSHEFWDELWKTSLTVEELFEVITPDDVRRLIAERPMNVKTLFAQAVAQLYQVVETPYPVYFDQALNCARILARVLPFMIESKSKAIMDLMWGKQTKKEVTDAQKPTDDTKEESKEHDAEKKDAEFEAHETEPLAVILINAMFHLLFLPDFTIEDPNMDFNEEDLHSQEFKSALMWAPGVGSSEKSVNSSSQYDKNRVDVLRLMIAAFSDSLFQNPDTYDPCSSYWLEVGTSADVPYAEIVFCSLMNTVLG